MQVPELLSNREFALAVSSFFDKIGGHDNPERVEVTPNELYALRVVLGNFFELWMGNFEGEDWYDNMTEEDQVAIYGMVVSS